MPIQSFVETQTELFFETGRLGKRVPWHNVGKIVLRKLDMLHYAAKLEDLSSPPGNRLEALHGKFKGHYSIRINDQWRIVFCWTDKGLENVRVIDYH